MTRSLNIAVFGGSTMKVDDGIPLLAREVGKEIARGGHVMYHGACPGTPYEAALGALEVGGRVLGYSPAINQKDHLSENYNSKVFDERIEYFYVDESPQFPIGNKTRRFYHREILMCEEVDAALFS